MKVTKRDYEMAIDAQSACNLSGVVLAFAKIMERICEDTRELGTDAKNTHPICRLFAEQIMFLARGKGDSDNYHESYTICEERSRPDKPFPDFCYEHSYEPAPSDADPGL